jgi:hypothetical protein
VIRGRLGEEQEKHTFAVDPQESAIGLPFGEDTAFKEPPGGSPVMNVACDVVIDGGIWRGNPSSKAISQLVPCVSIRYVGKSSKQLITNTSLHLRYLTFAEESASYPLHLVKIPAIRNW